MARVGLSRPYVAKYAEDGSGKVSYSDGMRFAKAVSVGFSLDSSDDNPLYGDNGIAENSKEFTGGKLIVGITELDFDMAALIYGLEVEDITLAAADSPKGKKISFGADMEAPYIGFAVIAKKRVNGTDKYMAVIFKKTQFSLLSDDYETQGKTISWKTPSLEATVMRDDSNKHEWRIWAEFDTEAAAEAYIKQMFGITDTPMA